MINIDFNEVKVAIKIYKLEDEDNRMFKNYFKTLKNKEEVLDYIDETLKNHIINYGLINNASGECILHFVKKDEATGNNKIKVVSFMDLNIKDTIKTVKDFLKSIK